jgi:hypothetical protein
MVAFLSMLISLIYQRFRFLFYSSFEFTLSFSSWNDNDNSDDNSDTPYAGGIFIYGNI